jgi:hypothetical protein
VEAFVAPSARIKSLAFVQQASRRTAVRKAKVERERPLPGTSASLDFTREFTRDVDGNIVVCRIPRYRNVLSLRIPTAW